MGRVVAHRSSPTSCRLDTSAYRIGDPRHDIASQTPAQVPAAQHLQPNRSGRTRVTVSVDEPELSSAGGALPRLEAARINRVTPVPAAVIGDDQGRRGHP